MNKVILTILAVILSAPALRAVTAAQDTVYSLESASVTGARIPFAPGRAARLVSVLGAPAVAALPAAGVQLSLSQGR